MRLGETTEFSNRRSGATNFAESSHQTISMVCANETNHEFVTGTNSKNRKPKQGHL